MNDCVFCKIISGDIPSSKVYEDEQILAFMTINAINEGHTLIIPKTHIDLAFDIEDELYIKIQLLAKKIARSIQKSFAPVRVGMMISGMEVAHAHFHIVPINEVEDISSKKIINGTSLKLDKQVLDAHAEKIKNNIE